MKTLLVSAMIPICLLGLWTAMANSGLDVKAKYLAGVEHFKQSTVRIKGAKVIYFDPFRVDGAPHDADLILVTHPHYDHFSIPDLKKVGNSKTVLMVTPDIASAAQEAGLGEIVTVVPNQTYEVEGVRFKTVPAYNINKPFPAHPKAKNWVGYLLYFNNICYYMAGDTDLIPEMKDIQADVTFLPVGGTYTMNAAEAAQAANLIKPKVAVPIHFGDVVGSLEDAKKFISLLDKSITGVILKQ